MLRRGYLPSSDVAGVLMIECFTLDVPLADAEGLGDDAFNFFDWVIRTFFFLFRGCFPREFEDAFSSS
jgi:hypothetical protein